MKKFKSFMLLCLATMMAIPASALDWPQASTSSNPKLYYIVNTRQNKYCKYVDNSTVMSEVADKSVECMFWFEYASSVTGFSNGEVPNYSNVYIHNICTNQTIYKSDGWVNGGTEAMFPAPQKSDEAFSFNIQSGYSNAWNDNGGTCIKTWSANDGGSMFYIKEVPAEEYPTMSTITWNLVKDGSIVESKVTKAVVGKTYTQPYQYTKTTKSGEPTATATAEDQTVEVPNNVTAPVKFSDSYKTATWYRITVLRSTNKYTTYEESTGKYQNVTEKPDLSVNNMFAFVGDENGFKIYNAGAGKSNALGSKSGSLIAVPADQAVTWELVNGSGSNTVIRDVNNQMGYINDNNNYFAYWYNTNNLNDAGSTFAFEEVDAATAEELVNKYVEVNYQIYYGDTKIGEETTMMLNGAEPSLSAGSKQGYYTYTYAVDKVTPETETIRVDAHWNTSLFAISDTRADAKWNKCTIRGKQVAYDKTANAYSCTELEDDEELKTDLNCFFAFVGNPVDGFKIYNAANKTDQAFGSTISGNATTGRMHPVAEASADVYAPVWNDGRFILRNMAGENAYVNENNNGGYLAYWISTGALSDDGSTWTFTAATDEENTRIQNTCVVTYNYYIAGNKVKSEDVIQSKGQAYPAATTAAFCTIAGVPEGTLTENGEYDLTVTVNTPFQASADYASATWYRVINKKNGDYRYLVNDGGDSYYAMAKETANVSAALWAFVGNPYDGYKIINKAAGDGKYLAVASAANGAYPMMSTTSQTWQVAASTIDGYTDGGFGFETGNYWINNFANDNKLSMWQGGPTGDAGSCLNIEAVEGEVYDNYQAVEIGGNLYATKAFTADAVMPTNLTAYKAKVMSTYVKTTPIEGAVKAENAVILKGAASGLYLCGSTTGAADIADNDLIYSASEVTADGTQYILANNSGIGFFQATTGTAIAAGKGYIVSDAGVKAFMFSDDATAIQSITPASSEGVIYNLAGQRINKMQKGVNIINGKKYLK